MKTKKILFGSILTILFAGFVYLNITSLHGEESIPKKGAELACMINGKLGKQCDFQMDGSCKKYKKCTKIEQ